MTASDIIIDDNMNCVIPFALKIGDDFYSVDKNDPGVYIKII